MTFLSKIRVLTANPRIERNGKRSKRFSLSSTPVTPCRSLPWGLARFSTALVVCYQLYCIVLYCIVLYCIVSYCIVLYCIVLYCIVLFNVIFNNSGYSLIQTNIKQFQGLHKAVHLPHKGHVHLFSWNQVLIRLLNFLAFSSGIALNGSKAVSRRLLKVFL